MCTYDSPSFQCRAMTPQRRAPRRFQWSPGPGFPHPERKLRNPRTTVHLLNTLGFVMFCSIHFYSIFLEENGAGFVLISNLNFYWARGSWTLAAPNRPLRHKSGLHRGRRDPHLNFQQLLVLVGDFSY